MKERNERADVAAQDFDRSCDSFPLLDIQPRKVVKLLSG